MIYSIVVVSPDILWSPYLQSVDCETNRSNCYPDAEMESIGQLKNRFKELKDAGDLDGIADDPFGDIDSGGTV